MNRFLKHFAWISVLFISVSSCSTGPSEAGSLSDLHSLISKALPGDTLTLKSAVWQDTQLVIRNSGSESKPIVIMAETAGEVVFSGNSSLAIAGDYVEVHGILFENGNNGNKPAITFRSGDRVANHSRVSSCVVYYFNPTDRFLKSNWVELHGKHNRVDHCSFIGKLNAGLTLAVRLNGKESQENYHQIDHNYFGKRPRLGSNGGESLRVGTSTYSLTSSFTQIVNNYFEHCNGEVEIISIKACDNTISGNTFYECEGVLTLRHGNNNILTDNVFIGNNVPHTGGIRVINAGHTVNNNHFQELAGHRFRSAFGVMNGVPNSAINRYHRVKDSRFENNVFISCKNLVFGLGSDKERTAIPENCAFINNVIYHPESNEIITELDDMSGVEFSGNSYHIASGLKGRAGFTKEQMVFSKGNNGLYFSDSYHALPKATKENTGAEWFVDERKLQADPKSHKLSDSRNIYETVAAASAGDTIIIAGDIALTNSIIIDKPLVLTGIKKEGDCPELKYALNREREPIIIIRNGGELRVSKLDFNGASENGIANGAIVTQKDPAIAHYNLFVDGCGFYNFNEGKVTAIQAFKSTFADSIVITNSVFHTISGLAINLKAEKEDLGKYNAEYVILKNCLFFNVMGSAIDLYRGGNDESTTGPSLQIDHCTFHNVENKELGSAINLTGVQDIRITSSIFSISGKSGRVIRLEDQGWIQCYIEHNVFHDCGRFESFYEGRLGTNNLYLDPGFVSKENGDFSLSGNSPLSGKGENTPGYMNQQ